MCLTPWTDPFFQTKNKVRGSRFYLGSLHSVACEYTELEGSAETILLKQPVRASVNQNPNVLYFSKPARSLDCEAGRSLPFSTLVAVKRSPPFPPLCLWGPGQG